MPQVRLERPDLFKNSFLQPLGKRRGKFLLARGREAVNETYHPNLAVLIRTRNDNDNLQSFINHLNQARKTYGGRIDLIVVDTESTDGTKELAEQAGATVVDFRQKDFNYPKNINVGMEKVSADVEIVFIATGHALPALSNCLEAGARHFKDINVAGVYGYTIPHENASVWEILLHTKTLFQWGLIPFTDKVKKIKKARMGTLGATNCMVRLSTWRNHKFDERYSAGGEDTAWAQWAIENGFNIIYDPALTVHHTHGLGFVNVIKQFKHWFDVSKHPRRFSHEHTHRRRPDLR